MAVRLSMDEIELKTDAPIPLALPERLVQPPLSDPHGARLETVAARELSQMFHNSFGPIKFRSRFTQQVSHDSQRIVESC